MKLTFSKRHIAQQHPEILDVMSELRAHVFSKKLKSGVNLLTFDMGRIVGNSACVKTTAHDEIVYAQRIGRPMMTRFTKSQTVVPTTRISAVVDLKKPDHAHIVTAFCGEIAAREPGDPSLCTKEEVEESAKFWAEHALVWGSQVTV